MSDEGTTRGPAPRTEKHQCFARKTTPSGSGRTSTDCGISRWIRQGEGRVAGWFRGPLPNARAMAVPASFNELAADAAVRDFFGDIWYQTVVRVPRGWQDRRVALHFESATHRATVWVDDTEVGSHEGGYTPFEFDITDHAAPARTCGSPWWSTTR